MGKVSGEVKIEFMPDGSMKINARGLKGADADLLAELEDLARTMGAELVVEKHEHHHGDHAHDHGKEHHHH
jgi:hypothetical protein